MDIKSPRTIRQAAAQRLKAASCDPRRLVLLHSGIAFAFSAVITAVGFLVNRQIEGTGGLSGMGLRSILSTIQTLLQYAGSVLMPFWQMGFLTVALAIVRGSKCSAGDLTSGFRRFSGVLGLLVTEFFLLLGAAFACVYAATGIFMATPWAQPVMDILEPLMNDSTVLAGGQIYLDDATMEAMTQAMLPLLPIFGVLFLALVIPAGYRLRMADYLIMDGKARGGIAALLGSWKLTKKRGLRLFRLDLHFWLFYLLQALAVAVGYCDVLLSILGVELPLHQDVAFFAFYLLSLAAQLGLHLWAKPTVQTSYALFYDALQGTPAPKTEAPVPKKLPWDYET